MTPFQEGHPESGVMPGRAGFLIALQEAADVCHQRIKQKLGLFCFVSIYLRKCYE